MGFIQSKDHCFGDTYLTEKLPDLMMKKISKGEFLMGYNGGYPREKGETQVTITNDFWLSAYPITRERYKAIMGDDPSWHFENDNYPVEKVNWEEANIFCEKLNELCIDELPEGYQYRLATEAEWEYAAQGGEGKNIQENLEEKCWFSRNSKNVIQPVGEKDENPFGLFDMLGNVFEWVYDSSDFQTSEWFKDGNTLRDWGEEEVDPIVLKGNYKIAKGGCWLYDEDFCRASYRSINPIDSRYFILGFRLCLGKKILEE